MEAAKEENGMVMIEAVYVTVIAIMIIFFTMNAGAIYYNRIVITAAANEAANGIAEVYGCAGKEPFFAYTAPEYFGGRDVYRYEVGGKADLDQTAEKKGKWYASYLIKEDEYTPENQMDFSGVTVERGENQIGAQTVSVTIKREYPVFAVNPAAFWGLDLRYEVKATGTAVCYDLIHQMNGMAFVNEIENKLDGMTAFMSGIDTILEIINKLVGYARK